MEPGTWSFCIFFQFSIWNSVITSVIVLKLPGEPNLFLGERKNVVGIWLAEDASV